MRNPDLLKPGELAERWSLTVDALADMRQRGEGPDYIRLAYKTVRYRRHDVEEYELMRLDSASGHRSNYPVDSIDDEE